MVRSIRWRLLTWYAVMLLFVIVSFATYLYWSAERSALQQIDTRLEGSVRYLEAAIRPFPVREMLRLNPFSSPPPFGSPGQRDGMGPRDGSMGPPRDGGPPPREGGPPPRDSGPIPRGEMGPPIDLHEKRPPNEKRPDRRGEGDKRFEGDKRGFDNDRRQNIIREGERFKRDLALRTSTDSDDPRPPQFFTIYRLDGSIFKSFEDPHAERSYEELERRLNDSMDPVFYNTATYRLVMQRGPERSILLVGVSMSQDLQRLRTLLYQLIGSGAAALLLGLLGSWYISGRIVQPLQAISATASKLSATHMNERIDTSRVESELVEVATVLNATFDRLENAFQRQSRFTADAGHELRTPLAVLHTNLELALSRPRKEEEFREIIEYCLLSSTKMRSLIDALLMLARADAGHLQANFSELDLRSVAQTSVAQHQSKAKNINLDASVPDEPVMVQGDPTLLGMILSNLIQNALRHTHDEGHVNVAVRREGNNGVITVTDDGIGIPLDAQPHLFERFYRVDASRNRHTGGHGLGLAICKSLAETQHGTIACESSPGVGTTFTLRFPISNT